MERYKPIVKDWKSFVEACKELPVNAIRRNKIKADEDFEEELEREFDKVEQSEWNPDIYRLKETETPGKSFLHWLGSYYVQEESAALPVDILSPEKGDKVLDMCAAPGGKSTQIASEIENKGVIISNDDNGRRLKSLHANIYRTGSSCISVTNYDGRQIPGKERFDRILVDAPCTGEADRARRAFENSDYKETDPEEEFLEAGANMDEIKGLAKLQKQLLEKAAELLKDGGTLVYSTCTFAPEENEEVVLHAVENTELSLEPISTDAAHEKGLEQFKEREYGKEMAKTVRIYPHHLNSGGMYVAKFRK